MAVASRIALDDPDVLFLGYFLWLGAALAWVVAVVAAIGFEIASKRRAAPGILAGIGVGFMALALTCFANLAAY